MTRKQVISIISAQAINKESNEFSRAIWNK